MLVFKASSNWAPTCFSKCPSCSALYGQAKVGSLLVPLCELCPGPEMCLLVQILYSS